MDGKSSNWRPGPSVCRCCLSDGCYKDIATEYFWMGKREVYEEMLVDTLGLTISFGDSNAQHSQSRLICETCISRLRNATDFKKQVKECEQTFLQYLNPSTLDVVEDVISLEKEEKQVTVKEEKSPDHGDDFNDNNDFLDDDNDDELDDQPLMNLATKVPKKESVDVFDLLDNAKPLVKRKSTTKAKTTSSKKAKIKETKTKPKEKPEKKKKVVRRLVVARNNAKVVLKYTTACPFRIPSNSMVCVYCCESYDDPDEYRAHMADEHKTYNVHTAFAHTLSNFNEYLKVDCTDLRCRLCLAAFDGIQDVARHLKVEHNKEIDTDVDVAMQMFRLGTERWLCAFCDMKYPTLRELSRHTASHYHKYTCEICGKSYINPDNLKKHLKYGHSALKICVKCKECFPSVEAKREHSLTSEKCWPLACSHCNQRFRSNNVKRAHITEVHGEAPKVYKCPECVLVFDRWRPYRTHFILTHTNDTISCPHCKQRFDTKRSLSEHVVTHTQEKSFSCEVCLKTFARKKNLIQHSWIHNEYKRFGCKLCSKQFNQRVSWKTHMKSYHPELVDFS
ncbi:zinc finger protein 652-B-like isoform X10 [Leptidea sinapis]|uniref:zinc finger protein 652-B-like isoform X10 n=1 Tax=Leptidea sinapis TaxID=189913 RepID=UPI0021C3F950|nr:zinc finger protein 652-B-like isoform X10 [Leptidea sinapis]